MAEHVLDYVGCFYLYFWDGCRRVSELLRTVTSYRPPLAVINPHVSQSSRYGQVNNLDIRIVICIVA